MSQNLTIPKTLFRSGAATLKQGGTLTLSISSDEPYLRYDWLHGDAYWEVLDHGPGGINLDRLQAGAALLFNHDRDAQLGLINKPTVSGGRCYVEAQLSGAADVASHVERVREGILKDCSVGYELVGDGVCIGAKDELPIYRFKWHPFEASLVTIPADPTVGVGRSHSQNPTTKIRIKMSTETQEHETTEQPPRRMTQTQEADHAKKIREFVDSLRNPAWKRSAEAIGERSILEGRTFAEFREKALQTFTSTGAIDTPFPSAHAEHNGCNQRSVGEQITKHAEFQKFAEGGKKAVSFTLPGVRSIREFSRSTVGTANVGTTVQQINQVQGVAYERLTIADLLAPGSMSTGKLVYPREKSFTSQANTVPEGNRKPEQDFDLESAEASAKKIAAWTKITDELAQDSQASVDYVNSRLAFAVQKKEDMQLLYGDGIGANMLGICSVGGIQTFAKGVHLLDCIREAIGLIDTNTDFMASGIVLGPSDWKTIETEKDTTGRYIVGQVSVPDEFGRTRLAPALWGLPIAISKSVTPGTAVVGAFDTAAQLFRRTGLMVEMTNCNEDDFIRNLITIRAELRAALAIYAPAAFVEVTGLAS